MAMSIPRCSECGKPLTCMCMSCRGRARTKRKLLSGQRNIAKARRAKDVKKTQNNP